MKKIVSIAIAAASVLAAPAGAQEKAQRIFIFDSERGAAAYDVGPLQRTEKGRATLECSYRMSRIADRASGKRSEQTFILLAGPEMSKFYDARVRAIDDLLQEAAPADLQSNPRNYSGGDRITVFQNMPAGNLTLTDSFSGDFYICEEPMPPMEWSIGDQTREILGYLCRRADCRFRGRSYTAWFAEEIPLSCGPWKFHGLPGLIMAVADSEGDYSFEMDGIERCDKAIDMDSRNYIDTDRKKYLRLKKRYLQDPIGFFRENSGVDINIRNGDGTPNTDVEQRMRNDTLPCDFLERDYE